VNAHTQILFKVLNTINKYYPSAFNIYQKEDRTRLCASLSMCHCLLLCPCQCFDQETTWQSGPYKGAPSIGNPSLAAATRESECLLLLEASPLEKCSWPERHNPKAPTAGSHCVNNSPSHSSQQDFFN